MTFLPNKKRSFQLNDKKRKSFSRLVKASRKKRISSGSGTSIQDVNKLLKQFKKMSQMMKKVGNNREMQIDELVQAI